VVEHDAQREQVAAGVAAHELHLLGRHVGAGAHRQRELLVQQVGQVVVAREAEVHQHGGAVRAEEDVAGLDVQVHHMLAVQFVQAVATRSPTSMISSKGRGASSSRGRSEGPGMCSITM
jgi:hypothetical protein